MSNDLVHCSAAQRFVLSLYVLCSLYIYISLDSNNIRFCTHRHLSVFENERSRKRERVGIHPATCNFVSLCVFARVYSPKCNCKIDENMALNALLKYLTLTMIWVYHWPFIHSLLNKSFKTFYPKMYQRHCASTLLQMQPNRKRFEKTDRKR